MIQGNFQNIYCLIDKKPQKILKMFLKKNIKHKKSILYTKFKRFINKPFEISFSLDKLIKK